jgi:LytS/YehU family sensor histidine kinase
MPGIRWPVVAYDLLFAALGFGLSTWLGAGLLRRDPAYGPPQMLLRWAVRSVALAAIIAALVDGLLQLTFLGERITAVADAVMSLANSVGTWALVLSLWLTAFTASQVFRLASRAADERNRLESSLRDAESRALRAQMDPHFLFNSLNTVRALIGHDPDGARETLGRYAEVLRYSLTTGRNLSVSLADELTAVENYLEVERQRFSNRMTVHIDVPDVHRRAAVPPLLLQTLVENAVRHGVSQLRQGGAVSIRSTQDASFLKVSVSNPAPAPSFDVGSAQAGIGLVNSKERLRLLHGDRASLEIRRAPTHEASVECWTVQVTLPLESGTPGARHV